MAEQGLPLQGLRVAMAQCAVVAAARLAMTAAAVMAGAEKLGSPVSKG
jgi:hypothetical protein